MISLVSLSLFLIVSLAVWQDLVEQRIPNVLTLGGLCAGFLAQWASSGSDGLIDAVAGAAIGFICFLPLYLLKGTGAGDVKLMAAVGAFLGPWNAFLAVLLTLVAGGAFGVGLYLSRVAGSRRRVTAAGVDGPGSGAGAAAWSLVRKQRFPYAVAIALGTIGALWAGGWLSEVAFA